MKELLTDSKSDNTAHSRIFKSIVKNIPDEVAFNVINKLEIALKYYDIKSAIKTSKILVPKWVNNVLCNFKKYNYFLNFLQNHCITFVLNFLHKNLVSSLFH